MLESLNANKSTHIFAVGVGLPRGDTRARELLQDIAANNGGEFVDVADTGDLRSALALYYMSMARNASTPVWTAPYVMEAWSLAAPCHYRILAMTAATHES